jgi:uncharacterized protein (TIGR03083 family)
VALDYLSIISDETTHIVDSYERDRSAAVPWSDRWKVGTVARHVAGTHHVVSQIIQGRPTADFGLFNDLQTPPKDSPEFVGWFRSGTASLLQQLKSAPAEDACWSWFAPGAHVGWWARRMAFETLVHRWDTDAAVGQAFSIEPDIAAGAVDEYLDVFVATSRAANDAPAGPTISIECRDHGDRWWLDLSERAGRTVSREPRASTVHICGTAEQLLLIFWGRVGVSEAPGVEISGDVAQLDQWSELLPPM